jgi:uncharacterized protein YgiM (DUF1202 family)
MVRRSFRPLIAFAAVIAAAGSVTAAGLTFTAHTVSQTVAQLPQVKQRVLPSYVVRLPIAKAADLDVSKSIAVKPQIRVPVTLPEAPVAQATTLATEATTGTRLVAEVTPLSTDTVEQPTAGGAAYVVLSDVSMRSGPSKDHGRVGTLAGGARVNVTDKDAGWLKVSFAGSSGWVYQRYLAPAGGEAVAEADTGRAPF